MVERRAINPVVLVFKTKLNMDLELKIRNLLSHLDSIIRIDFDFEDRDKILRVEALNVDSNEILFALHSKGYYCQELV